MILKVTPLMMTHQALTPLSTVIRGGPVITPKDVSVDITDVAILALEVQAVEVPVVQALAQNQARARSQRASRRGQRASRQDLAQVQTAEALAPGAQVVMVNMERTGTGMATGTTATISTEESINTEEAP